VAQSGTAYILEADCGAALGPRTFMCGPGMGGAVVTFTGSNYGRDWPGNAVSLAFGMPTQAQDTWAQCLGVVVLSQSSLACTLPPGAGGRATARKPSSNARFAA
jgi:hypothetical protein